MKDTITCDISELKNHIKACIASETTPMIWGAPGVGKSEVVQQVADEQGVALIDFRANLFDPVDVRGIPFLHQKDIDSPKQTGWAIPDVFPRVERDGDRGILFIDEITTAPTATQNSFLQLLIKPFKIGDYKLPPGWRTVCAGNRMTDGAAVYQMPATVKDRVMHYTLTPTLDAWCNWAFKSNIHPDIISFIRYRPNLLLDLRKDEANPSPRTWALLSKTLPKLTPDLIMSGVTAAVGEGAAGEFITFRQIANKLPNLDTLIANPTTYVKDDNPALLYALSVGLASRADQNTMANIMEIAKKIPIEYQVVLVKGALAKDRQLLQHNDVVTWSQKNQNVVM